MKTTNIGLVMLTALVVTKYIVTLEASTVLSGSFESGLIIEQSVMTDFIASNKKVSQPELLAYSPSISETNLVVRSETKKQINRPATNTLAVNTYSNITPGFSDEAEKTLPMEHSNSLVVFDPASPAITNMKTQYVDQYDNATPLDNGNTVVNEMMMMMPKR